MLRKIVLVVLAAAAVVGCSRQLPTIPGDPVTGIQACAGVGLDAFLHGNPSDPRTAWLEQPDGTRQDVQFPAGYSAAFTPTLQVLDPAGRVAMEEGDYVYGACVGAADTLVIDPSESLRLDCGPFPPDTCRANAPSVAANQPGRDHTAVAAIRFTSADGDYVLTFDDGTTVEGQANLGG